MSITTAAAIATIASSAFGVASATGLLGGKQKAQMPPPPQVPAQAASTNRNDTASTIVMGADNVKNQRVGGVNTNGGTQAKSTSTVDILGGLGAGGINV